MPMKQSFLSVHVKSSFELQDGHPLDFFYKKYYIKILLNYNWKPIKTSLD